MLTERGVHKSPLQIADSGSRSAVRDYSSSLTIRFAESYLSNDAMTTEEFIVIIRIQRAWFQAVS